MYESHTYLPSMPDAHTSNLLGALVVALGDEVAAATAGAAEHGSAFPAALVSIQWVPGISIEALRGRLNLTHSGTVRLLDRLEADGAVVRRAGKDARTLALALTPKGKRLASAVLDRRRDVLDRALGRLPRAEQEQLGVLLGKLLGALTTDARHAERICRLCDEAACDLTRCPVELAARP